MTIGMALLLLGAALLYAGITGRSVFALLRGDDGTLSKVVHGSLTDQAKGGK